MKMYFFYLIISLIGSPVITSDAAQPPLTPVCKGHSRVLNVHVQKKIIYMCTTCRCYKYVHTYALKFVQYITSET